MVQGYHPPKKVLRHEYEYVSTGGKLDCHLRSFFHRLHSKQHGRIRSTLRNCRVSWLSVARRVFSRWAIPQFVPQSGPSSVMKDQCKPLRIPSHSQHRKFQFSNGLRCCFSRKSLSKHPIKSNAQHIEVCPCLHPCLVPSLLAWQTDRWCKCTIARFEIACACQCLFCVAVYLSKNKYCKSVMLFNLDAFKVLLILLSIYPGFMHPCVLESMTMVVCMDDFEGMWVFDGYFFCRASQPLPEENVRMNELYGRMHGWMGCMGSWM